MKNIPNILSLLLLCAPALPAEQKSLHLEIGDPGRKGREVGVILDAVVDTANGELLTPAELPSRLAGVRLLFVGESHTDIEFHKVQLRIIEELDRAGRRVMIGLEMYPYTSQSHLDAWIAGDYTEEGFIRRSEWYDSWSYHWYYYRDIFLFARDRGLPMFAVNTPREVVKAVRQKGFEGLTEEERAHVPPNVDTTSDEHRTLFRSYFDEDDPLHAQMTDEQWEGMVRAQATWDATMAYNSVKALEEHGQDPETIVVVLIGAGHVAYGLGIERQAQQWSEVGMASVIPVPVRDEEDDPVGSVRASYADYVWGLPPTADPLYPSLGLSTREADDETRRQVIYVAEESVAERAGFEVGDVLVSMDGVEIDGKSVVNRLMAEKRWGDRSTFAVERGGETVELEVLFRRSPPDQEVDESDRSDESDKSDKSDESDKSDKSEPIHHRMTVDLDPEAHTLTVRDRIALGERRELLLNAALEITESNPPVTQVPLGDVDGFFGINAGPEIGGQVELARYRLDAAPEGGELELAYGGRFDFGLTEPKEEYTRGFRETAGIVGADGVFLAGSGFWYPYFDDRLITFDLEVTAPEGWHVISQGDGASGGGRAKWSSGGAMTRSTSSADPSRSTARRRERSRPRSICASATMAWRPSTSRPPPSTSSSTAA